MDRVPLETAVLGCVFCGASEVVTVVQGSPEGKVCGWIFVCKEHLEEADALVILKPGPVQ